MLLELQSEVRGLFAKSQPHQDHLASQLKKEVKDADRQIADLARLLAEVKHRRPLIRRIDSLEGECQELELRLSDLENAEEPAILSMNEADLEEFAEEWRSNLGGGTMDKRKTVFRQIIDSAVFDGEELEIAPNLSTLTGTGVKMASPRGFEPLLPP